MSDAKLSANRDNAKKSTGPKTDEGRRKSAMNAVRHGFCARTVCVHGEEAEQFNALVTEFAREHRPASATEYALVYRMAVASWNLRRLTEAETSMIDAATLTKGYENGKWGEKRLPIGEAMLKVMKDDKRFNTLQIYQQRLERAFYRALSELRRVRKEQMERQNEDELVEAVSFAEAGLGEAEIARLGSPALALDVEEKREQTHSEKGEVPATSPVEAKQKEQTNPPVSQVVDAKVVTPTQTATSASSPEPPAPEKKSVYIVDKMFSNEWRRKRGLPVLYPELL